MNRRHFFAPPPSADPSPELVFDAGSPGEPIRPLHGVNGGSLAAAERAGW